jgi:hypothetical protein
MYAMTARGCTHDPDGKPVNAGKARFDTDTAIGGPTA